MVDPTYTPAVAILMVIFAVLFVAICAAGIGVSRLLHKKFESDVPQPLELLVSGAVLGFGLWIAASWILALTHTLTRAALFIAAALLIVCSIATFRRTALRPSLLLLPIALWTAFVLFRGAIVPPVNHDALSYHLPKSVLMMRAGGFSTFDGYDHRFTAFPANYELLAANLMILGGSDRVTEWIGTAFFLLFLCAAALFAQHWWGSGPHVIAAVLATASAPVVLLHSAADKNDLMAQFFVLTALFWGARWAVRGGVMPMILLIVSVACAVGTKTNAAAVAIGLLPFVVGRIVRRGVRWKPALATVVFAAVVFLLCGGAVFVAALSAAPPLAHAENAPTMATPLREYGTWSHIWRIPLHMFAAGVSARDNTRDILFSSHFGAMPTLLVVLLPLAIRRYRKTEGRERAVASAAALIAFAAMLPANHAAEAMPRYAMFILPLIVSWTIAPAVGELLERERTRRYGFIAMAMLIAVFAMQSADAAIHDVSCPIGYLRRCIEHPGTRVPPSFYERSSLVADRLAGADDTIALSGDVSAWIHPLFGAKLTRPVLMLPAAATAGDIPKTARWVVIERMSRPPLYDSLLGDRRFELVFRGRYREQALFRRIR